MNHPPLLSAASPPGWACCCGSPCGILSSMPYRVQAAGITPEVAPYLNRYAMHMEVWLRDPDGYRVVLVRPSAYDKQHEDAPSP